MSLFKNIIRKISEYTVFIAGLMFIFVLGLIYAFIAPESLGIKVIFVLIVIGWAMFLIKYFWELLEKSKNENEENLFEEDIERQIEASEETREADSEGIKE